MELDFGELFFGKRRKYKKLKKGSYVIVGGRKRKLYKGKNGKLYYRTKSGKRYVKRSKARCCKRLRRRKSRKSKRARRRRRKKLKMTKKAIAARRYYRKRMRAMGRRPRRSRYGELY